MRITALLVVGLLYGCGPSCEDRGGKLTFSHHIFLYNPALKTNQMIPQYVCEMPATEGQKK